MAETPKLRFAGFTDAWEQRKLGDITNIIDPHPSHRAPPETSEGIPFIGIGDVDSFGNIDMNNVRIVDKKIYQEHHDRYDLSIPSLGIGRVASLGKIIKLRTDIGEYAVSPTMSVIQVKNNINVDYLYSCMESPIFQIQFSSLSNGSTRQSVGIQNLRELNISIPRTEIEQNRIGKFFNSLDYLITLHQRKCEELQNVKKFCLQKMFPKNGETQPELRFAGFTDDWDQRKFGELYVKVTEKNDLSFGVDKIISVANMYYKEDISKSDDNYMRTYNVMRLGDIAFEGNKSKNFAHGRFVENTIGDGIVSHVFDVFRPITEYDLFFWKYLINYEPVMGRIMARCTKASTMMTNLVANDFLKEEIVVPCLAEQQKIGEFFLKLDNLITLHQRKCEELQRVKKFCLQNMFPGAE